MKSYIGDIVVTDSNGEKAILYPRTKQEAVEGLVERLENVEKPDITETTETTMPNSYDGRFLFKKIKGVGEQKQYTGKNLIPYPYYEDNHVDNGITWSVDENGVITAKGTSSADSSFMLRHRISADKNPMMVQAGTYRLSGFPSGLPSNCYLHVATNNPTDGSIVHLAIDKGSGAEFTLTEESQLFVAISIASGNTINNLVVKPMVRLASITDATWEPYVGGIPSPNPEYPQEVVSSVVSEIKSHGKNFIPYPYDYATITSNGVTWTDLGDGRIMANGTATADSAYNCQNRQDTKTPFILPADTYILSGCPSGGTVNTYRLIVGRSNPSTEAYENFATDIGNGATFTNTEESETTQIQLMVKSGVTVNNLIFEPMLRLAEDSDATWEPYKESVITLSQPIELRENGGVKDELVTENGILKVIRRRGKHRVTSAEKGTFQYTSKAGQRRFAIKTNGSDWIAESDGTGEVSTHFKLSASNASNHGYFYISTQYAVFPDNDSYWADLDAFKAWLDSNEVYIEYNLKTPIVEELPLADQIALNSLDTFDGITYLEFDSEIKPEFEGKYGTTELGGYTLESLLVARNNDIRISSVEASVVNNI